MESAIVILIVFALFGIRRAFRCLRQRIAAPDPYAHPFGEVMPLPSGSLVELHSRQGVIDGR